MEENREEAVIELENVATDLDADYKISGNGSSKLVTFSRGKVQPKIYATEDDYVEKEAIDELVESSRQRGEPIHQLQQGVLNLPRSPDAKATNEDLVEISSESQDTGSLSGTSGIVSRHLKKSPFKRWWYKVPLMYKMLVIGGLPTLGLIVLTAMQLSRDSDRMAEADNAVLFVEFGQRVLDLLTHTQVERALTQVMMGDPTPENVAALADHRANKTDVQKVAFTNFVKTGKLNVLPFSDTETYEELSNYVVGLDQHRQLADQLKIDPEDSVTYFNTMNDLMVSILWFGENVFTDPNDLVALQLVNMKTGLGESLGIERMLGSKAIIAGGLTPTSFVSYLERIASSKLWEKQFNDVLAATATGHAVDTGPNGTGEDSYASAFSMAQEYRRLLSENNATVVTALDWTEYFGNFTTLILAHKAEAMFIFDHLSSTAHERSSDAETSVITIVLILVMVLVVTTALVLILVNSIKFVNKILRKEVKKRKTTEQAIWRFFPQEFMTLLNKSDILNVQQGDRRHLKMCVMFSDIRDFTTNSEKLGAEQTYDWLMGYVQAMGPIIKRHNGFIDKTLGDGIMALFTYSQDALECALAMQMEVEKLNLDNFRNEIPAYNVGIGLHTGNAVLGVIGDNNRLEGTIVSDAVNTAARIEGLCKFYKSRIIISGDTYDDCDMDRIGHRYLGSVKCVGKVSALDVYDVYQCDPVPMFEFKRATKHEFEAATRSFQQGDLEACSKHMKELSKQVPHFHDGGIHRRLRLCEQLKQNGIPDDWHGEDVASEK